MNRFLRSLRWALFLLVSLSFNLIAKTLVLGNGSEPGTLNPFNSETTSDSNVISSLFEGLTYMDKHYQILPAQAESWTESEDGLLFTFQLRKGLKWSNGDSLTAHDFVFAMRYCANPENAMVRSQSLKDLHMKNAQKVISGELPLEQLGIRAVDDHTLEIQLDKAVPFALSSINFTVVPLHRKSVEKYGDKWPQPGNLISNGAYKLDKWVVNEYVSAVKNPHYRESDQVNIEEVMFLPLQPEAELKRYQAGEVHITDSFPSIFHSKLKAQVPDEVRTHPTFSTYFYEFNLNDPKFSNKYLRQALALSVDRDVITKLITRQGESPAYSTVSPRSYDFIAPDTFYKTEEQKTRNEKARELLKQAGFEQGSDLEVELLYNTRESHRQIALAISDMWKRSLGVKTRLRNMEFNSMLADIAQGKFELSRKTWVVRDPEPCYMLKIYQSDDPFNDSKYNNPKFDALLEKACTGKLTPEHRKFRQQAFQELEAILAEDMPGIPILHGVSNRLVKPEVKGFPKSGEANLFRIRDLSF
ncbi:peptide ABC transporter substrate-binding protein [Endozoicomonas arenosclerae]|uniref:peptide ABC transporter substrate-binding protein n=1 Tax=Endozoicomonas arenosclerae TaxID=1633495 RepID=UPI000A68A517|nr:peptide ABC transporter substrate-binding protein [Endozoicomonas arenosclerae]